MKKILTILLCLSTAAAAWAQPGNDKAKLEKERQDIQRELQEAQSAYSKVKGQTKATIGQLTVLQKKLDVQDKYIGNINKELRNLSDDIYLSTLEVNRLQVQLDTLKAQYARSVVYAYKNKSSYDFLNFVFSSSNFNDAMKRVAYLKSYRAYREQQATNILNTQKLIEDRKQQLLGKKSQKKEVLSNQQQQLNELEVQKKEKDNIVSKLKSQEKTLSKEIAAKKKRDKALAAQMEAIVRREIEKARKEAADREAAERAKNSTASGTKTTTTPSGTASPKTTTSAKKTYLNLNAADVALNTSFEKNRGRLPWPVDNGVMTIPFGTSKVGEIMVDNPGITISTPSAGTPVKALFDGEVSAVSNLGDGMMVMIRHGKYFTVYSNLGSASVSRGTAVKSGQVIGKAGVADDGQGGQVDLILMNETNKVNPAPWLRK